MRHETSSDDGKGKPSMSIYAAYCAAPDCQWQRKCRSLGEAEDAMGEHYWHVHGRWVNFRWGQALEEGSWLQ